MALFMLCDIDVAVVPGSTIDVLDEVGADGWYTDFVSEAFMRLFSWRVVLGWAPREGSFFAKASGLVFDANPV